MFGDNEQEQKQKGYVIIGEETRKEYSKRQTPKRRSPIFIPVLCLILSGVFGYIGGYASNQLLENPQITAVGNEGETGDQYQKLSHSLEEDDTHSASVFSVADVAALVKSAVVEITTETVTTGGKMGQLIREGAGSGVIVSEDGNIVTNNHVISGARNITVRLADGTEYGAKVLGTDSKTDLAIIKIEESGLTSVVMGDSSTLTVGETMVAVGNPLGELGGTVTSGILSALDRAITIEGMSMRLLQTDAAINPGNSGGGLFNLQGELVGIVNAKSSGTDVEGLGFAIPINTAKYVIESILNNGYVPGRIDIGLTLIEISDPQMALLYRVNRTGLYVYGSANKDFLSGDRIDSIDGIEITGLSDYHSVIDSYKVGDTVRVMVSRRGQTITIKVILTELQG